MSGPPRTSASRPGDHGAERWAWRCPGIPRGRGGGSHATRSWTPHGPWLQWTGEKTHTQATYKVTTCREGGVATPATPRPRPRRAGGGGEPAFLSRSSLFYLTDAWLSFSIFFPNVFMPFFFFFCFFLKHIKRIKSSPRCWRPGLVLMPIPDSHTST